MTIYPVQLGAALAIAWELFRREIVGLCLQEDDQIALVNVHIGQHVAFLLPLEKHRRCTQTLHGWQINYVCFVKKASPKPG